MHELRRLLLNPRRLLILVLAAVLNLAFFTGYCGTRQEQREAALTARMESGLEPWLDPADPNAHYREEEYPAFLEMVQKQAKSQVLLSSLRKDGDIVSANLKKTAADYAKLSDIVPAPGDDRVADDAVHFPLTDYLLLAAALLLVLELADEERSGRTELIRSAKRGRVPVCAARMLAVVLHACAAVLLLFGGNVAAAWIRYGNPVLSRPMQSMPLFQTCPYRLTLMQFLLAAGALKVLALTLVSLMIWLLLSRLHPLAGWGISGLLLFGNWLCLHTVLPTAKSNHLHDLNLAALLDAKGYFLSYRNLNWFGSLCGMLPSALCYAAVLLVICVTLCTVLLGICRPFRLGEKLRRLTDRLGKRLSGRMRPRTLLCHELRRLLICERGLLWILIAALAGAATYSQIHLVTGDSKNREFQTASGPVTDAMIEKVDSTRDDYAAQIKRLSDALTAAYPNGNAGLSRLDEDDYNRRTALLTDADSWHQYYAAISQDIHSLRDYTDETGYDAWYIPRDSYKTALTCTNSAKRCTLILLLFLIAACSGLYAYDNQYDAGMLLRSTPLGRGALHRRRLLLVGGLTLLASLSLHGIYLFCIGQQFGFVMPQAPAHSLEMLRWMPWNPPLWLVLVLHALLQWLAAFAAACAVTAVSRLSRTPQKALFLSLALLLVPAVLSEAGLHVLDPVNLIVRLTCSANP